MSTFQFDNKRVLVTGASRGIGYAVAKAFAKAGAQVWVLADDPRIHDVAQTLGSECHAPVHALQCDISDRDAVASVFSGVEALDVLVNNAGLERLTPMADAGSEVEDDFRRIIDINVIGTYYVTREALPRMSSGGRIVLTASVWGKTAVAEFSAYCASKHANIGFMRSLAQELAPRGINVNAVCPGWVRTEASMASLEHMAVRRGQTPDRLLEEIVSAQALPGLMDPDDVASTYLFLASEAAANITGQALSVDRGEVMT
jgi:NAD(P)-dependent dehydrogenase (short-subunit alcohol dehydrogenase family)